MIIQKLTAIVIKPGGHQVRTLHGNKQSFCDKNRELSCKQLEEEIDPLSSWLQNNCSYFANDT